MPLIEARDGVILFNDFRKSVDVILLHVQHEVDEELTLSRVVQRRVHLFVLLNRLLSV